MNRLIVAALITAVFALIAAGCASETIVEKEVVKEVEVPVEKIVEVEKEVVKEVEVQVEKIVEKEVVKEVMVEKEEPGLVPEYGGTQSWLLTDWVNLDPYRFESNSLRASGFVYEKLSIGDWTVDREVFDFPMGPLRADVLTGLLAEGWDLSGDLQTLDLTIRQGVTWHDKAPTNGRDFTVDDVIWNIDGWWREDEFIDRQFTQLIDNVEKLDDWSVRLDLNKPLVGQSLVGVLDNDSHFFVAKESRETDSGEIEDWQMVSGTGPWVLANLVPDSILEFEKNPNYWGFDEKNPDNRLPYADGVSLPIIPDPTTQLAAFRTGKLDAMYQLALKDVGSLLVSNPDAKTKTLLMCCPRALRMRWDLEPFNDIRLRQAVSMAIDRDTIVDTYYEGQALRFSGLLKPFHRDIYLGYEELPADIQEVMTYNPERARELVAEAGYADGLTVDLNIGPNPDFQELAVIIQQYLKDIGIETEIIRNEWPEFNAIRYGKQHRHLIIHWNSFYADPMQLFEWFACKGDYPECLHKFGLSGVNDPVFTEMYEKATVEYDDAVRAQMMQDMELYQLRDVFFATLPYPKVVNIWHPWLGGFQGEGLLGQYQQGALAARLWIVDELKR